MVADALSRKAESMGRFAFILAEERPLASDIQSLANRLVSSQRDGTTGSAKEVYIGEDGVLRLQGRLRVPNVDGLRERIQKETHSSWYSIHLGATKMYHDLRQRYWWKWECITMDFVVGLPRTLRKFDAVWVIVDRLTKSTHFIPVVTTYTSERLAQIYIREIVRLHSVPVSIISYRGPQITSHFWRAIQNESLGYEEEPVAIVDKQDRQLISERISTVKVQLRGQSVEKATWESEEDVRSRYLHLFSTSGMVGSGFRRVWVQIRTLGSLRLA
ncbi:uncharacterized protein [Nicotiana sylvestris]|uniref:uncharacterized protein n=1 Tax=Nicotiana sylvestris TaxID=4096 RepID=UPI00388CBDE8